jgi:radical SAM protein with 4Fe4S-binding SPASM domain
LSSYQKIDIEFAKAGIFDYFSQGHDQIRFFSLGEATIEFDAIAELMEFSYTLVGDRLTSEIQTNGIMSKYVAHWIGKHINNIWISWDGPPEVQNTFRPTVSGKNTSGMLERNVEIMLQEKKTQKKGFVGARVTVTGKTIDRQKEIIDYLKDCAIKYVYSDPVFIPVEDNESLNTVGSIELMDYCKAFVDAHNYAKQKGIFYGSFYMINFDKSCSYHCRSCLPTPHLIGDGFVSCCDMALDAKSSHMQQLIYGYWDRKNKVIVYDYEKINHLQTRTVKNIPACQKCEIAQYCGGYCIGEVLNETGDFYGILEERCEAIRFLAKHLPVGKTHLPVLHP